MKFQAHSSLEPLEYNQNQMPLTNHSNNFALSDAEVNTFGPSNRGGIADLPWLRTLLAILQKRANFLGSDGLFFYYHMQVRQVQEPF